MTAAADLEPLRRAAARFAREEVAPHRRELERGDARARAMIVRAGELGLAALADGAPTGAMGWNDGRPELGAGVALLAEIGQACAGSALLVLVQGIASAIAGSLEGRALDAPAGVGLPACSLVWGAGVATRAYWFDGAELWAGDVVAWEERAVLGLGAAAPCVRPADARGTLLVRGARASETAAVTRTLAAVGCAAIAAGAARAALDDARAYAALRWQGGARLAELPIVRAMLGRADARAREARLLAEAVAAGPLPAWRDALAAFLAATAAAAQCATDALQAMGGYGYMEDQAIEKRYRDARSLGEVLGRRDDLAMELGTDSELAS